MNLSTADKVQALRELTRGPDDVFAAYSLNSYEEGGAWRPVYALLEDHNIISHLAGYAEIGAYPMLPPAATSPWPNVYWVLADFDGKKGDIDWKADVKRAVQFLLDFDGCPCFVNLSRSGKGAHIRMLFREAVPAWMARRWLTSWLEEADVIRPAESRDHETTSSFDRLIPPQDSLSNAMNNQVRRPPGNLAGSPLHGGHARKHGGTLPLDPHKVARGDFGPDGQHWRYVMEALERRAWGKADLKEALVDCPTTTSTPPPIPTPARTTSLPLLTGNNRSLDHMLTFCKFVHHLQNGGFNYALWVALATQLHRFGNDGREAFHELSSLDPRYDPRATNTKWNQTRRLLPIRCDSMPQMGFTCPHLKDLRCNGVKAPTFFADNTYAEIL